MSRNTRALAATLRQPAELVAHGLLVLLRDAEEHADGAHRDLGAANFDLAFEFLEAQAIRITGRDVGGRHGRKVVFHSHLGDAWVKRL